MARIHLGLAPGDLGQEQLAARTVPLPADILVEPVEPRLLPCLPETSQEEQELDPGNRQAELVGGQAGGRLPHQEGRRCRAYRVALRGHLGQAAKVAKDVTINYGIFINAVINFVIVAFVLFLLLRQLNKLVAPPPPATEAAPPPSEEVLLLREIRDSLKSR